MTPAVHARFIQPAMRCRFSPDGTAVGTPRSWAPWRRACTAHRASFVHKHMFTPTTAGFNALPRTAFHSEGATNACLRKLEATAAVRVLLGPVGSFHRYGVE